MCARAHWDLPFIIFHLSLVSGETSFGCGWGAPGDSLQVLSQSASPLKLFGVQDQQEPQQRDEAGPEIGDERFLGEVSIVEKLEERYRETDH